MPTEVQKRREARLLDPAYQARKAERKARREERRSRPGYAEDIQARREARNADPEYQARKANREERREERRKARVASKHYYECLLDLPVHLLQDTYEYISRADAAHNEEHIQAVVLESDRLYKGWCNHTHRQVIAAALMHDLGCAVKNGRDTHEVFSAQIAGGLLAEYKGKFSTEQVLNAILEHRGSFTGERIGLVSNIVAAADRGRPNAAVLFMRAYVYTKEVNDVCHDVAVQHAIEYNKGKYGYKGYARMRDNRLLMKYYPDDAVAIEKVFEEATVELVIESLTKLGVNQC